MATDSKSAMPAASAGTEPPGGAAGLREVSGLEQLERKPVLAVLEWSQAYFEGTPQVPDFVLYDDGFVVARRGRGDVRIVEATLPAVERDAIVDKVDASRLLDAPVTTRGPVIKTHTPSTTIELRHQGRWKTVTVEGFYNGAMMPDETHEPPPAFRQVLDVIGGIDLKHARPFVPRAVKVTLREGDSTGGAPLPWPSDFPQPPELHFPPGDSGLVGYTVPAKNEHAARALADKGRSASLSWHDRGWFVASVEPSIPEWAYLELVRYCAGEGRAPVGCNAH